MRNDSSCASCRSPGQDTLAGCASCSSREAWASKPGCSATATPASLSLQVSRAAVSRAMAEALDADPADAVAHAEAIENTLHEAGVALEQVHHGDGMRSGDCG